jgi:HSP20 family protein
MALKDVIHFGDKSLPVKREEVDPFALLRRRMDDMFEGFLHGFDLRPFEARSGVFSPSVDVVENEKDIRISAELPGMEEKDIEVSLGKDSLTIRGEKKEEKEDKGKGYYRMERSYGSFSRVIALPSEIDQDKVKATFKKGVLTVTLPKTEKAIKDTKKIEVKSD